jgi:hypothetical protein
VTLAPWMTASFGSLTIPLNAPDDWANIAEVHSKKNKNTTGLNKIVDLMDAPFYLSFF